MERYFTKNSCKWMVAVLVLLNLAVIGFTFLKPPPPGEGRRGDVTSMWQKELHLSNEQAAKFRQSYKAQRERTQPLFEAVQEAKKEMIDVAEDPAAVKLVIERSLNLQRQLDEFLLRHYLELRSICTPEQQQRLEDIFLKTVGPKQPPPPRKK